MLSLSTMWSREIAVDVARGMTSGKDDWTEKLLSGSGVHAHHAISLSREEEFVDTSLEMHLTARRFDLFAHTLDDAGQAVGADVGMGIGEDVGAGTMLAEDAEDALHVAALFRARIEFAIGEGSCPTLSEGIVALAVDDVVAGDSGDVFFTAIYVASTFEDDGAHPEFYESEGCKESSGSCSHNDGLGRGTDIAIVDALERQGGGVFVDEDLEGEIDHHLSLSRIDATLDGADGMNLLRVDSKTLGNICTEVGSIIGYLRENTELEGSRH